MRRALALAWLLGATAAQAQLVVLSTRGAPEERARLTASAGELLQRLHLTVVSEAAPGSAVATVVADLGEEGCVVKVSNRGGAVVAVRRVPRAPSSEVTTEAVAHVVQSAVEALLEQERSGPRAPPAPAPDVPVATAPPGSPLGVELGAVLTARSFGTGAVMVFGGGVLAAVRLPAEGRWAPRFGALVAYTGPFASASEQVQLSTQTVSVRALGGVRLALGPFALDGQLGAGFDSLFTETRSTTLLRAQLRDRHEVSPVLSAQLAARYRIAPTTELLLAATADLDLLPRRYVAELLGERTVLLETWRVRPSILLGFTFDVLAGGRGT